MFRIYDGRDQFFQWDLDRKISVSDSSITQLHFSNATTSNALVVEVKNGLADVPNILLQDDFDLLVYGYDVNYTKHSASFEVLKRQKPESYVYTETEVLNYNALDERVSQIEQNGISDEKIEQAITNYLDENPVEVDLTGYATEVYVDDAISAIPQPDLSGYALKSEIPSTSGLATEKYVDDAVSAIDIPEVDLEGYATEKYVDDAVAAIVIPDTSGLATEKYVDDAIANLDIPEAEVDLSDYYTKAEVDDKLDNLDISEVEVDLSNYYTKREVDDILTADRAYYATRFKEIDDAGYQTAAQVETAINNALGVIENGTY